jgi:hypothetical protein
LELFATVLRLATGQYAVWQLLRGTTHRVMRVADENSAGGGLKQ